MHGWEQFEVWRQRQDEMIREAETRRLVRKRRKDRRRNGWRVSFGGWILSLHRASQCAGAGSRNRSFG
jgi:hypothetical protein